jgi:hypothetical protein
MSNPKSVTFIVGGEKFELSRSLLDMYPNTVLSTSAAERWQEDPESEIIMDRDPVLFRHVLAYLRDKKVYLPTTVAKEAVLFELEYYCVNDVDEDAIDDSLTQGYLAAQGFGKMVDSIEKFDEEFREATEKVNEAQMIANSILAAKECVEKFLVLRGKKKELVLGGDSFKCEHFYVDLCDNHLAKVGLQMLWPDEDAQRFIVSQIKPGET